MESSKMSAHNFNGILAVSIFLAFLLSVQIGAQTQQQYCAYNQNHTMCLYQGRAQNCTILTSGVNKTAQDQILYLHNLYRGRVAAGFETRGNPGPQPAASNMNALIWDPELARIAQRWTDQCQLRSDAIRDIPNRYGGYVGQNMYAYVDSATAVLPPSSNPETTYWQTAIDRWYNRVQGYNPSGLGSYTYDANTSHYTQVVWASTTAIGCGFTQYASPNNRVSRIHACNYGPGGNRRGQPVYTATSSAQSCSTCAQNCQGYLCVSASNGTEVPV